MVLVNGDVKLIDFGLAFTPDLTLDVIPDVPGTLGYMAPELIKGNPGD